MRYRTVWSSPAEHRRSGSLVSVLEHFAVVEAAVAGFFEKVGRSARNIGGAAWALIFAASFAGDHRQVARNMGTGKVGE